MTVFLRQSADVSSHVARVSVFVPGASAVSDRATCAWCLEGLWLRVEGFKFRGEDSGFVVGCLGWWFGVGVKGFGLGVWGVGCGVWGLGLEFWGLELGVWGLGSRI